MENENPKACLFQIKSLLGNLFHAQQKVAQYVLDDPPKILSMSISELAEVTSVSEATVLRFVRAIGYKGYSQFRIALAADLTTNTFHQNLEQIHEDVAVEDDFQTIFKKVFYSNINSLSTTLTYVDEKSLERAAHIIYNASKIQLIAVGNSQPIAMDALHRFLKLGKMTVFFSDPVASTMFARLLKPSDVAIGISFSGQSIDVIEVLKIARSKGSQILAITSHDQTPLTEIAHVSLFAHSQETRFRTEAMESRIVQLSLIDALFVSVAMINPDQALKVLKETTNPLPNKWFPKNKPSLEKR
ncbi:MAG: MurR/RpiR family transcriptional regulator [Candidatus Atribacteria bacterium]|nr:MurR/RpiR family transcriptional regulator [Candidatus Atribacteria bacterium]